MRNVGASASEVVKLQGTEPINVIGIQWVPNGPIMYYSDKEMAGTHGLILELGAITNIVDDNWVQTVSDVSVTLNDVNGDLRTLFNEQDIHKIPATVYQTFEATGINGIFPLTPKGQITSPITYDETARTMSFNITTQLELPEAGYSSESASIERTNQDDYKDWPMAFGDVVYVPAVEIDNNPVGKLRTAFGNVDPLLVRKIDVYGNRNRLLSAQYAALVSYDAAALNLVSPALNVLQDYILQIGHQDSLLRQMSAVIEMIDRCNDAIKQANGDKDEIKRLEARKKDLTDALNRYGNQMNVVLARKETVKDAISGINYELQLHDDLFGKMQDILDEIYANNDALRQLYQTLASQQETIRTEIVIENGRKFPQSTTVDLLINDSKYTGTFANDVFTITAGPLAKYGRLEVTSGTSNRFTLTDDTVDLTDLFCLVRANSLNANNVLVEGWHLLKVESQQGAVCKFSQSERRLPDPPEEPQYETGNGISRWQISEFAETLLQQANALPIDDEERRNIITLENLHAQEIQLEIPEVQIDTNFSKFVVDGENILYIEAASPIILPDWLNLVSEEELQSVNAEGLAYNEVGSTVQLYDPSDIYYITNIIESEVVAVHAYKTTPFGKVLFRLPSRFYTVHEAIDLQGLTVTAISLKQRLSSYVGLNWQDDLYVTMRSDIGPETPDILSWLVSTYTSYTFNDTTSVDWSKYPMHFALFGRHNTLELIKDIAYQARCGIYMNGTELQLVYLSSEGTPVDTITNDDIYMESLSLTVGDTESLATKIKATWQPDYLPDSDRTMVLRHNILKYGTQETSIDFFAYTDRDLVEKSATFWLIRNANSWKQISFSTPLTKLAIEPFDTVTLSIQTAVELIACNALITQADYDSSSNQINFKAWIPIKLGTVDVYDLAYPSDVDADVEFPTESEVEAGYAGSGVTVTGTLGPVITGTPYNDTRPLDWGRKFLSDSADTTTPQSQIESGNLFAIEDDIPPETSDTYYLPPYPDIETYADIKEERPVFPERDAYIGWILEGARYDYEVILQTGQVVACTLTNYVTNDPYLKRGEPVYVVRGNEPNQYYMYSKPPIVWTTEMKVKGINPDFLVCENPDGEDTLVARPFSFWRSIYHGKTINGWDYTSLSHTSRLSKRVSETGAVNSIFEVIYNHYQVGDRIAVGYMPFGLVSPTDGVTNYIDLNVNGLNWMPVTTIGVTVSETTNKPDIDCVTLEGDFKIRAKRVNRLNNFKVFKGALAYVVLDPSTKTYGLLDVYNKAETVVLVLTQDLQFADNTGKGNRVKYFNGIDPGDNVVFQSPYYLEGNVGDNVVCMLTEEGDYVAKSVIPVKKLEIKFTLTAALVANGNAAATDQDANVVTVYDELGFSDIVGDAVGYAKWRFSDKKYYIWQMEC